MGRPPCCDKSSVKRGLWTAEEDAKILHYVSTNGPGNWTSVPKKAGLKRCGKSCRLRWTNYLRPDLKHDNFTPQEEEMIVKLHSAIGSRWSLIAMQLPGRTDNDVKNHWNTKLRKKLVGMGIDPVTHKPFSQILTDYGNIGGLPKTSSTRTGSSSLNKDLKYSFMPKTEPSSIPQLDHDFSGIGNHPMMTVRSPTIQDGSFFNLTNHPMIFRDPTIQDSKPFNSNNQTLELLAQLQAIKLATQASSTNCNIQETSYLEPHFFNEGSSSSSSSSSSSNIRPENSSLGSVVPNLSNTMPSSSFSWSEFLLDEAFLPPSEQAQKQEEEFVNGLSATNSSTQDEFKGVEDNQKFVGATTNMPNYYNTYGEASTSTGNSFVEAILDRDSQMLWEFPNLLEEPFY